MEVCYNYGPQRIKVPEEGKNFIEFKNFHKMLKLPFAIYADFEALNVKVKDETTNTNTQKLTRHDISGYAYCVVGLNQETRYESYRGPDAGEKFLRKMQDEKLSILKWMKEMMKK